MLKAITPDTMRGIDRHAIATGISSLQLMEQAAESAFEQFLARLPELGFLGEDNVLVLCGTGNNGGDGLAMARMLSEETENLHVYVCVVGNRDNMSPETSQNFDVLETCDVHMVDVEALEHIPVVFDVVVDALLGIGSTLPLRGDIAEAASFIRNLDAVVVSIDIPTGVCASSGATDAHAVFADFTCTMEAVKTGMLLGEAPNHCGDIVVCPIGAPASAWNDVQARLILENKDIRDILHERKRATSKKSFGHVVVVGGCATMPGAPTLTAHACISAGAGMVTLITPKQHALLWPDIMCVEVPTEHGHFDVHSFDQIEEHLRKATTVVVGPGMGAHAATQGFVARVLQLVLEDNIPAVIDADALRALSAHTPLHAKCVLTPHEGEFAHLIKADLKEVTEQTDVLCQQWARQLRCTIAVKSNVTRVSDGKNIGWNSTGTPALATAGSGDVLAGMTGALLAQGIPAFEASLLASHWHGLAAQYVTTESAPECVTASKVVEALGASLHVATGAV